MRFPRHLVGFYIEPNTFGGCGNRAVGRDFDRDDSLWTNIEGEIPQETGQAGFDLQQREAVTYASSRSVTEGHEHKRVAFLYFLRRETVWIEFVRLWVVFRIEVEASDGEHQHLTLFQRLQ